MLRPSGPARLSLLYAVVFTEIGIAMPFMPLWLDGLGLDAGVIGVLLALPIATRIVATAPLMSLLDRGLGPRRLILLGSLALSLTYALMPGAAGIGWALARLADATGDERFREAARGALRFERDWFSAEHGNWPDLRESQKREDEPPFLFAWCHGAPGIGLARVGILPYLDDPALVDEIRVAVRTTLAHGFGGSHSLCHGDLGNLELIREAGRALGDAALTAEAERLAGRILAQVEAVGPRCGARIRTESLGLMIGLAGIGYGLLRAAYPLEIPSILLLETPEPSA